MKSRYTYLSLLLLLFAIVINAQPKPENGLSGVSILPYFEWSASGTYYLQISTSDDFSTDFMEVDVNGLTSNQVTESGFEALGYSPLSNETKYYWRIADGPGAGATSIEPVSPADPYFFTTVANVNVTLSNPSDGSEIYPFDPLQFSWFLGSSVGSLKFVLQVKASASTPTASEWTTPDIIEDNISSTSKSISGLTGSTNYFWRVIVYYDDGSSSGAFDVDDRVVKYSTAFEFATEGGAVKAYPSWPVGGNTIYNLLPTYYWYTLQYDAGAAFEVFVVEDGSNIGDLTKLDDDGAIPLNAGTDTWIEEDADLDPSTTYLWQVKTTNGSQTNYSDIAEFTTYDAPGLTVTKPTLSYPVGGLTIYTTSPTLYWYIEGTNGGSFYFEIELSTDGGSTWSTYPVTTSDTYLQVSGLTAGMDYTWRVTHTDGVSFETSDNGEFSIAGGMSSTVVLSWPIGNPTLYTTKPTLSWYLDGSNLGWDHFVVRWNKGGSASDWGDGGDYDGSYSTSDLNETFYSFTSGLDFGSTYYWAVALHDGSTVLTDGDFVESSFSIAGGTATVELTYPENNSIVYTKTPTFYWYLSGAALGIDKYKVTYSNTELFTANVVELESLTTNVSVTGDLDPGTTYWWYVSVSYDNGATYSTASPTWKFTIDPGSNAVMPIAASPSNGLIVDSEAPTLSWYLPAQSESVLTYELQYADNAEFSNAVVVESISELFSQTENLQDGSYYWRVRSTNGNSTSSYSNVGNFKIGDVTDVKDAQELPLAYMLEQNYPNPFNPTTTIKFSLPQTDFVTIKVYDMLGREVALLVEEEISAGSHRVKWNGVDKFGNRTASGIYIYRIKTEKFSASRKMLLLK